MSGNTRLRATLPEDHGESLEKAVEDRFEDRPRAEREIFARGLQAFGYLDHPDEPSRKLLWVVNRVGLGLGFLGLVAIGVGVFGPRIASVIGFGTTLTGLLLLVVESVLDEHAAALRGEM